MIHRYAFRLLGLLAAFMMLAAFLQSCEETKEVIKTQEVIVHDTVLVEIISVDSVFTEPDNITQGATVALSVNVTVDPASSGTLTYRWFADGGEFSASEGETVDWKAPDDAGSYTITVHVSDGSYVGLAARRVGVGMYAPTVTPYYLGEVSCSNCHANQHAEWSATGHADAWATLQESGHPASFCEPCHAVGFVGDPGNGGYDEAPIAKFVNVQCENCHGAASDHVGNGTPDPTKINVSWNVENCGQCHEGTHHPYLSEWTNSPHANPPARATGSCNGCHEGVAASIRLSGESAANPLGEFYDGGEVTERPDTSYAGFQPIVCSTCHDPHNVENPGQIRTVADVPLVPANGEEPVVTIGGTGKLCMQCHHARRGPDDQVINGYSHFGPHSNPQTDIAAGKSGYQGVAAADFPWASPSHLNVANSCKTCHLNMAEFDGTTAITGHTFMPTVAACAPCHGAISDFSDILALDDFDGDGTIEGVQLEVAGLMEILEEDIWNSMIARGVDTTGLDLEHAIGDTSVSSFVERGAGFNLIYLIEDGSHGIHNPDYVVQLLQQSIQYLTGAPVPNAVIVREEENAVTAKW